jgi:hypothetical protein
MDIYDITQIGLLVTATVVLARLGLALASRIERRPSAGTDQHSGTEARLRALEEESTLVRRELAELQERQDFAERMLQSRADPSRLGGAPEKRAVTPR